MTPNVTPPLSGNKIKHQYLVTRHNSLTNTSESSNHPVSDRSSSQVELDQLGFIIQSLAMATKGESLDTDFTVPLPPWSKPPDVTISLWELATPPTLTLSLLKRWCRTRPKVLF